MAISKRTVYFYDGDFHVTKRGSLSYDSDTAKYLYDTEQPTINEGEVGVTQLVIALPLATLADGAPMIVFRRSDGYISSLLPMSQGSWTIIEVDEYNLYGTVATKAALDALSDMVENDYAIVTADEDHSGNTTYYYYDGADWNYIAGTSYQTFYITMNVNSWAYVAGKHAFQVGYLAGVSAIEGEIVGYETSVAYDRLDLDFYTVSDGINVFDELQADTYEEIYNAISSAFSDVFSSLLDGTRAFTKIALYNVSNAIYGYLYFDDDGVMRIDYAGISHELGENLFVRGDEVGTILNGDAIMYDGSIGASGKINLVTITSANVATLIANPHYFVGVATQDFSGIQNRANWYGGVSDLDTTAYPSDGTYPAGAGKVIYVDMVNGGLTYIKPAKPLPVIEVGVVVTYHATQGRILVRPSFSDALEDLSNVDTTGVTTNVTLKYDGTKWVVDTRVTELVTSNPFKTVARTGTDLITLTRHDDTTATVITLAEFRAWLGNATTSLAGLMSATDKTNLDTLMALFDADGDAVVNTIQEVLDIFSTYPEGVTMVSALATKVDKTQTIAGVDFADNITANELKTALSLENVDNTSDEDKPISTAQQTEFDAVKLELAEERAKRLTLEALLANANINQTAKNVLTTTALIESTAKTVAEAPIDLVVKGLSLYQGILDGDMDSVTNWDAGASSNAVANNVLTNTGDGSAVTAAIQQADKFSVVAGGKYFIHGEVRVTNALCTQLYLTARDGANVAGTNAFTQANPANGTWYYVNSVQTLTTGGTGDFRVTHTYGSTGDATGAELELRNCFVIPLDNTPISAYTATEVANLLGDYWEGWKHITDWQGKFVGKNLVNYQGSWLKGSISSSIFIESSSTADYMLITDGLKVTDPNSSTFSSIAQRIRVKPSTAYTLKCYVNPASGEGRLLLNELDNSYSTNEIHANSNIATAQYSTISITTNADTSYLEVILCAEDANGIVSFTEIQLEEGTVATTREAYREETLTLYGTFRSIDASVYDLVSQIDNVWKKTPVVAETTVSGVVSVDTTNYPLAKNGGKFKNYLDAGGIDYGTIGTDSTTGAGTLNYELDDTTPIPIETKGNDDIYSMPSMTITQGNDYTDAGAYNSGITIQHSTSPISELTYLAVIDFVTGLPTTLDESTAVIASGGLSFTHSGISDGDIVFFEYKTATQNNAAELDITYYDSRYVIADTTDGKYYKWSISSTNGVASIVMTEV